MTIGKGLFRYSVILLVSLLALAIAHCKGLPDIKLQNLLNGPYKEKYIKFNCNSIPEQFRFEITQMGGIKKPAFSIDGTLVKGIFEVVIYDKVGNKIGSAYEAESSFLNRDFEFTATNPDLVLSTNIFGETGYMFGKYNGGLSCRAEPIDAVLFKPEPLIGPEVICKDPSSDNGCVID